MNTVNHEPHSANRARFAASCMLYDVSSPRPPIPSPPGPCSSAARRAHLCSSVFIRGFIAVCCLLPAFSCCGYSVRSLLPPHLRTVAVPPVQNSTLQPGLDDQLTDLLTAAFNSDRSLHVTTLEKTDLAVNVTVTAYSREASVYDENQTISTYDLTATAQVEAHDHVRDESFFSGPVSEKINYNPASETEDAAATRLMQALAAEIVRRVITAW